MQEFEDARRQRQRANDQRGYPIHAQERAWGPYLLLALKSFGLFEILRMALDGGAPN